MSAIDGPYGDAGSKRGQTLDPLADVLTRIAERSAICRSAICLSAIFAEVARLPNNLSPSLTGSLFTPLGHTLAPADESDTPQEYPSAKIDGRP